MRGRSGLTVERTRGDLRFRESAFCSPQSVITSITAARCCNFRRRSVPGCNLSEGLSNLPLQPVFSPQLFECGFLGTPLLPGLYTCDLLLQRLQIASDKANNGSDFAIKQLLSPMLRFHFSTLMSAPLTIKCQHWAAFEIF